MLQYSGLTLAYIGDAYYELMVREYLIEEGDTKVDTLHTKAIVYTSALGQAQAYETIKDVLSEDEQSIFKRGRNAKTDRKARNASLADYKQATGFESLIGYLYLNKQTARIQELWQLIVDK